VNPATGDALAERYPISSRADVETALEAAHQVVIEQAFSAETIASFLT
jgi:hypothetical protein